MAAVVMTNHEGVRISFGDPSELRDLHRDCSPKISDWERCALVRQRDALVEVERRLRTVYIIGELVGLGDYGLSRFKRELRETQSALDIIRHAMNFTRDRLGMAPEEVP